MLETICYELSHRVETAMYSMSDSVCRLVTETYSVNVNSRCKKHTDRAQAGFRSHNLLTKFLD